MIILIALSMVCYVAYSVWIIDKMCDVFNAEWAGLLASLFCIIMPLAIVGQILVYVGVIK